MDIATWLRMHPTRKARTKARGRKEPLPVTVAPTSDLNARHGSKEQLDPRLPHERDEVASGTQKSPRDITTQGHRDLADGQVDTDARNRTEETIDSKSKQGLRHKP